jgi:hypothetical protein
MQDGWYSCDEGQGKIDIGQSMGFSSVESE